jgi:hypothetical protein
MSVEIYTNQIGKQCFKGVADDTPLIELHFTVVPGCGDDEQFAMHTNLGSLTVLDRMTGFGYRDIETGWREALTNKFWLASGQMDVRDTGMKTMGEAILWVKNNANNCVGE